MSAPESETRVSLHVTHVYIHADMRKRDMHMSGHTLMVQPALHQHAREVKHGGSTLAVQEEEMLVEG